MTLPVASVLTEDEKNAVNVLAGKVRRDEPKLTLLERYYDGQQRIRHVGLGLPPELRSFSTVINIPRIAVDEPVIRQSVRGFYRTGNSTKEDPELRRAWEANNLASESTLVHTEEKIFGRDFVAVGTNENDPEQPLITVEDPRQIAAAIDVRRRQIGEAFRLYRDEDAKITRGTYYGRETTLHLVRGRRGWQLDDTDTARDDHGLGVVPLVMFLHRRRAGKWTGLTEMADVIGMTDDIARLMGNMNVASDGLATPHRWAAGVSKDDFVDKDGNALPAWEAYMTAIKATANDKASFGQFLPADLANFHNTVNNVFAWCAAILGLPTRYAGQQTVNPAAEGAIRADESRLIGRVERMNRFDGDSWAWVMGLEERLRTGEWGEPNSIRVLWQDPATPTLSQIADSAVKMRIEGGLSVEGMWDMLGWDEPRKQQERGRLIAEARDGLGAASRQVAADAAGTATTAAAAARVTARSRRI